MSDTLMSTYNALDITITHGEGVWLWDSKGKKYLDAFAGIAVTSLGHAHPAILSTIQEQASKLMHISNAFLNQPQLELADKLTAIAQMDNAFFCNSGAEANECAIKLARLYGHEKGIETPTIIVTEHAFHGRTLATLTASGNRKVQAGFEPLVQGFLRVPFNDLQAIQAIASHTQDVVAVMVEPIQGEGGIFIPDQNYLAGIRELCNRHGWLMIVDEIQTGIGRTGKWFAHQHHGIKPDIMTLAKALGNGIPIGACLAAGPAKDVFKPGNHGSTYGGNPLCTAVALTVLKTLEKEGIVEHAASMGAYFLSELQRKIKPLKGVVDVRGQGMMLGIELEKLSRPTMAMAAEEGLLFNTAGTHVIRLVPPLIFERADVDYTIAILERIIPKYMAS